ncbi:MAG: hypothetical protein JSW51_11570 [Gemmatimonadota bacterium]|nr:MAG: hypothetical protein JSW51_11570 [Gemmatimonadota bacterium]
MRAQLADYSKGEFMDLAINLQNVIDDLGTEKRGLESSLEALGARLPALEAKIEQYESGPPVDADEVAELREKNEKLRDKYEELRERFDKVQALNEKFQEKLLDAV